MIALVVPCHRQELLTGFLDAWAGREWWDRLIVVEDAPARSFTGLPAGTTHVAHEDIDADLGAKGWVISRGDSAIRSYGFLRAWRDGAETIFTLDSDCYPHPGQDVRAGHLAAMYATPRWASSIPGLRVRGLPYGDAGGLPVHLSVGLWSNVPDLDGVCQLAHGIPPDFLPPAGSRVLARGQYVPICGMNLAFRREFAPLAYFGLQGPSYPFARFDDIWFGVIAKRVCDHLGWAITVGEPWIRHDRASDPFANLVKEAPGLRAYEVFWRRVDAAPLTATTAVGCMVEIADHVGTMGGDHACYWERLARAMRVWVELFA
jgi:reversibly glycosylated polypeptide / UDP-arabinopyranose mutase